MHLHVKIVVLVAVHRASCKMHTRHDLLGGGSCCRSALLAYAVLYSAYVCLTVPLVGDTG